MMSVGRINESNDFAAVKEKIAVISKFSDEDFLKKLGLLSGGTELHVGEIILEIFEHFAHNEHEFRKFLMKEGIAGDKMKLLVRQFQAWMSGDQFQKTGETEREKLIDLHWKLTVASRNSSLENGSVDVEVQLVVEANGRLKRHHLRMSLEAFHGFLQKLDKSNVNIQEILNS